MFYIIKKNLSTIFKKFCLKLKVERVKEYPTRQGHSRHILSEPTGSRILIGRLHISKHHIECKVYIKMIVIFFSGLQYNILEKIRNARISFFL